ncbi:MAG: ester cyclase [Chitinophagaceae bacterium]
MRQTLQLFATRQLLLLTMIIATLMSCSNNQTDTAKKTTVDSVAANIKMYSHVWDEIINKRKLEMFNDSNFTKNVVMHASPADVVGIDSAKAFYANYLTGFSDVTFTVKDVFGMGNKLAKHWNFKGTHTGVFFGIPATNKKVDIDGVTLVRMENGKIAEERDVLDNLEFMQQLGLIPQQ